MDLQQKSWLSEVRMTTAGSVVCDKRSWSPELSSQLSALSIQPAKFLAANKKIASSMPNASEPVGTAAFGCPPSAARQRFRLPLCLTAGQFLDLGLFRSARIIAGLERLFRFAFLAGGAFGFLAFFFG